MTAAATTERRAGARNRRGRRPPNTDGAAGGPVGESEPVGDGKNGGDGPGPYRRCIASGRSRRVENMVRFVVGPDGTIVPDVAGRLPGRGLWLSAERDMVDRAVEKNGFSKAARVKVTAPADLADRVEGLLARRCLDLLGLARRAGQAAAGYEKVCEWLRAGKVGLILAARDGAEGGRGKVRALAPDLPVIAVFSSAELGRALGREQAVHVVMAPSRLAERLRIEVGRLSGFRPATDRDAATDRSAANEFNSGGPEGTDARAGGSNRGGPEERKGRRVGPRASRRT